MLTENSIHHGDSLQLVQQLAPRSVDLICSDPPYGGNEIGGINAPSIANNSTPLPGLLAIQRSLSADELLFPFLRGVLRTRRSAEARPHA